MSARKICVVTGSRADYGLLRWLMADLRDDPACRLQVAVTGTHMSAAFGETVREIEADGFVVDARVDCLPSGGSATAVAKSMGLGVIGFADVLPRLSPDLMVVLGDRYEIFGAAAAAMLARVPIAHIHGGETTEGAIDEAIRHSITKMAHLHFTSAEPHRQLVLQLGEAPDRVFNFGAPGLDAIRRLQLLSRQDLEAALGIPLAAPLLLVTYHPATLSGQNPAQAVDALLQALDRFPAASVVFTKSNADEGGQAINQLIEGYCRRHSDRMTAVASLGQLRYLSLAKLADVVIGNSSSGLIEVPALGTATVNIGIRQQGRLRGSSVIDCPDAPDGIAEAIGVGLSFEFRRASIGRGSPYGDGTASERIKEVLMNIDLAGLVMKRFVALR